ncbi:redoxin domain-containing protein [Bythopirellula goksoeyrii]|uniref:redoxin domain-containing protein n=1 Tax=Bythopirellula goksoeyrii TaxID=1400387 RepID=UPI0011CD5270|nr:redoxin domain-containing protein [Bythopirellula goksoeyrii]
MCGVLGVSGDSAENHRHFKEAHNLNFTLLADPDGSIAKSFGVKTGDGGSFTTNIGGKEITLDRGVTANRWTFVIDRDGKIVYKNTSVNPTADSEEVMAVVEKLEGGEE